jgi:hypothetical protein
MELLVERDRLELDLLDAHRPLEEYFGALETAGFLVERLREIPEISERDGAARWRRIPPFLHIRAVPRLSSSR